ncbi:MAG: uroporphyrinogen-III synthase [Planctomycetes bacterium]|nr:uroporphyrinogen-III synthase [Planctomycetota bacterium]
MKIWVTRDEESDGPLSTALREVDLDPVLEPVLERHVLTDAADSLATLRSDDWLILTSAYAVNAVHAELARIPRVAVVGEPSKLAAEAKGFRVGLVSGRGDGKSLFEELRAKVSGGKICYPRSALVWPPKSWPGVDLISPILYETTSCDYDRSVAKRVDVVSVGSPSAVDAVGAVNLPFASIGPSTTKALKRLGIEPWVEATHRSFASLAKAIADHESPSRHQPA